MLHQGSCHCGNISFEVDSDFNEAIDCNCSMCRRRGGLLAFVPAASFVLKTPRENLSTYRFNKHVLDHHFCSTCGIAPFSEGHNSKGEATAAVNLRCLPDLNLEAIQIKKWDGANH